MDKILENFPPVHFISVDYCEERREKLYDNFSKYGITNITGHIFKKYDDSKHYIKSQYLDRLSIGSRGPVTSHLKAIKEWYETTNESYAFFCEDDLSFETLKFWNFTWNDFYTHLPKNWQIVQLCWLRPVGRFFDFKIGLRNRCWCDSSGCAYLIKREFAKKLIENYIPNEVFYLDLQGSEDDISIRPDWAIIPIIETIIFSPFTQVYGIPLFVEDQDFLPSYENPNTEDGKKQEVHPAHRYSHDECLQWWQTVGYKMSINEIMTL